MARLEKTLLAWGTPDFELVLKREVAQLGAAVLPLQQGLSNSSAVADGPLAVVVKNVVGTERFIRTRLGLLYQGVIGGCSCADDPTPDNAINEYCEVRLDIDRATAGATVVLIAEAR